MKGLELVRLLNIRILNKNMVRKGSIRANELLAVIIMTGGAVGFIFWGLGVGLPNSFLLWIGQLTVAIIIVIATFLSRWLK